MSLITTDNGDGTVTLSNSSTGQIWSPIAKTEIARRKAAADARRAERQPPLAGDVFLSRFTDAELSAIYAAAAAQLAAGNAQLHRWIVTATATNQINVAGTEAQAAKTALVAASLLTSARADIVFAPQG